jgi:hypothetical protein
MVQPHPARPVQIVAKTIVAHTVTYFVPGVAAFVFFDYPRLVEETVLGAGARPLRHPLVLAGPGLQPLRGLVFGLIFYALREPFFNGPAGWLRIWMVLAGIGVVGTFGAPPASIEGVIYSELPLSIHLMLLTEMLGQSLALSKIVFHWVTRPSRWLTWTMSVLFVLVLLLSFRALSTH